VLSLSGCGAERPEQPPVALRAEQFAPAAASERQTSPADLQPSGLADSPPGANQGESPSDRAVAPSTNDLAGTGISPVGAVRTPGVRAGTRTVRSASAAESGDGLGPVRVLVGSPALSAAAVAPGPSGPAVSADAMVGQINGKPVFASEILDPLDGRLAALTREVKVPQQWTRRAGEMIGNSLIERVRNELVVAEARNRLSPQERAGLLNLVGRLQSFFQAQAGGSLEQAREDLQTRTGEESLDRILADERDQVLIRRLFNEAVEPNVRVPWSAVERYYRENPQQFSPAGEAVFRVVIADARDASVVERITLAAGDDAAFAGVAASEANAFLRDKAGERRLPLTKPLSEQEVLGVKAINELAVALVPGSFLGPLEFPGGQRVWVRREQDVRPSSRSFDQAQLEIVAALTGARRQRETAEFTQTLLGTSSYTPIEPMVQQLINMAIARHQRVDLGPAITPEAQDRAKQDAEGQAPAGEGPGR
jgi:hypothetical protein